MAFESGFVPDDWRSSVIVPLYKGKGEMPQLYEAFGGWKSVYGGGRWCQFNKYI